MELLWYPLFGITIYLQYDIPLGYTGISFLAIVSTRGILVCGFCKMVVEEDGDGQSDNDMVRPIEMVR